MQTCMVGSNNYPVWFEVSAIMQNIATEEIAMWLQIEGSYTAMDLTTEEQIVELGTTHWYWKWSGKNQID